MTPPVTLTAILASHNRKAKTLACLDALFACAQPAVLSVILFDDASTDGTAAAVHARHPTVRILHGDGQSFWAGGMRAAFAEATCLGADFYLWLNDDVCLEPDALVRLIAAYRDLHAAGCPLSLVGGAVADRRTGRTSYGGIVRPARGRLLRFQAQGPHPDAITPCDTLVGNVVMIPRLVAETVGGIDPAFRHTLADLDYGLRVTAAGGRCALSPGHLGWCEPNQRHARWFNPALPLAARWRLVGQPLGFPLRPWLRFARRHGGHLWFLFALLPFWRLFIPLFMARRIDRLRAPAVDTSLRHAS